MADTRRVVVQVRLSQQELAALEAIGHYMAEWQSGVRKLDGTINQSAVVRRLIREERARHG